MPKFIQKPQIVEAWEFVREALADRSNVPEWVASRLKIEHDCFVIINSDTHRIEVFDGQWLIKLDNEVFPLDREAFFAGFDIMPEPN